MRHPLFTDDHEELRRSLRAFVEKELQPHADEWEEAGDFPDWVFTRMGELGFLGLHFDPADGGQGGDYLTMLVLSEEMARCGSGGVGMAVSVQCEYVTPPIAKFGTEAQRERYLRPAVRGERIGALGITEPDAGSDVAGITTKAIRDGDEYVVNGRKTFITNGHRSSMIVLVTKTDPEAGHQGFTLFLVPMDSPGVIREKRLSKMGMHASDTALLAFSDVRVPDSAVLGEVGKGFHHIMWELQAERLIGASSAVAYARYAFDKTVQYAHERHAFGRPIGQHQAIRHKIAAMATKLEAAQQLVYGTAWAYAQGHYPVREISMAKLFAAQTACEVADECVQIHGGAGYMTEYGVERVLRDLRLYRIGAGTDEIMLDYIGKSYGF